MNNLLILLPILFPGILSVVLALTDFERNKRNIFVATGVILNLFLTIYVVFNLEGDMLHIFKFNDFLDIYLKIDKLGVFFSLLVATLWVFTTFYSIEYMKHEGKERRFFAFFTLTLGITLGIAFAGNLITLYLFYELLTLCTFPLVIHNGSNEALQSGKKYLIYSFSGATMVLFGTLILFSITNNLNFIPKGVFGTVASYDNTLVLIVFIAMFLGFGVKAALAPFHSWLPAAMVAPTPVSSLLHAVAVVKSGVFALIRVCYFIFGVDVIASTGGQVYMAVFVVLTILMGSFLALHQDNLKKRLAYSTISQLGYILLGIIMLNEDAFVGGLLHLINHAVIKITLFFCAGAIMYTTDKKNISEMEGIGKRMPITMWCFGISSISLVGIPPTNGFVSKWFLAIGGLAAGKIIFPAILLLSALLTAMYLFPVVSAAFFKKSNFEAGVQEAPLNMLIPIVCITIITVILGVWPNPILNFLREIANSVF
ncbi:complex I subunit 5 family protein [Clostridium sp. DL1XJH146]